MSCHGGLNNENSVDIGALEAWKIATGRGVNIAIVDVGINRSHPDLMASLHSLSCNESGIDATQFHSHGTKCALIAAAVNNNKLMIGVAYDAKVMEAKAVVDGTKASAKQLANCINWAWRNGADVISCSWEANKNDMLKEALDNALSNGRNGKGAIIVKSAGNTSGAVTWPADYRSEILVVSAIDKYGSRWQENSTKGSSYGNSVDVCAPGANISICDANGSYYPENGTSIACPFVAGVADWYWNATHI
ncbi:MAG: S8 family serine peptidase [Bacteroidales bacterium]|nr:S8 family serine peptidase [Bacteroidales bacterium]